MKHLVLILLLSCIPTIALASTPIWQQASEYPDRVILNPTQLPSESFSVNWRTSEEVEITVAQIAPVTSAARFDLGAKTYKAKTQRAELRRGNSIPSNVHEQSRDNVNQERAQYHYNTHLADVAYHEVTFKNLKPNTRYAYRVRGGLGKWSEWYMTKTAGLPSSSTTRFLYFSDAQNGMREQFPALLRKGFKAMPDADFALYTGDLVDHGARDLEWAQWFSAGQFIHAEIPVVPVVGNHEYAHQHLTDGGKQWVLSRFWQDQFKLPTSPELSNQLQETAYTLHYPNTDVFIVNTEIRHNETAFAMQTKWLRQTLSESKAKWKIIAFHHPIFSNCGMPLNSPGQDEPAVRSALLPLITEFNVDLVLQGHDHAYSRGSIKSEQGTHVNSVFVTASSSPKAYPLKKTRWDEYEKFNVTLERVGENTPTYQAIKVHENTLSYRSYTLTGELYDAFDITKTQPGNVMTYPYGLMKERLFSNTEPYKHHNSLY